MSWAIRLTGLGKQYSLGGPATAQNNLREEVSTWLAAPRKSDSRLFWALRDLDLEIEEGSVVGVIGRNGAGKSTLLKILSRVTAPTCGRVEYRGRVASLLEVGTGFHRELTGRENIFLNGSILGMRRNEIRARFDEIVAFSRLEEFVDTPVKHYSSGMAVRLAFAVAAHLRSDILLADEVLAVGDAEFQSRCLGAMGAMARAGRTVIFVSHNMAAVGNLCRRGIVLDRGRVVEDAETPRAISRYMQLAATAASVPIAERADRQGDGAFRFTSLAVRPTSGPPGALHTGQDVTFALSYEIKTARPLRNVSLSVAISNHFGQYMGMLWTRLVGRDFAEVKGNGEFRARLRRLPLMPGRYSLNLWCEADGMMADWVQEAAVIDVVDGDYYGTGFLPAADHNGVLLDQEWEQKGGE